MTGTSKQINSRIFRPRSLAKFALLVMIILHMFATSDILYKIVFSHQCWWKCIRISQNLRTVDEVTLYFWESEEWSNNYQQGLSRCGEYPVQNTRARFHHFSSTYLRRWLHSWQHSLLRSLLRRWRRCWRRRWLRSSLNKPWHCDTEPELPRS